MQLQISDFDNFETNKNFLKKYLIDLTLEEYELNTSKTVIIGLSGGVDSSVGALILKLLGYKVIGIFMKNWQDDDPHCSQIEDYEDVRMVAKTLKIDYYTINFSNEYNDLVFNEFLNDLNSGLTPNPDILCNRFIKFDYFYNSALNYGADYLATGHYCNIQSENGSYNLTKGNDNNKDQSYFLAGIRKEVLPKVLFPIGKLIKKDVREIARDFNLITKNKKDSTGICFIGERKFSTFISDYIKSVQGNFINLKNEILGVHQGTSFYTIGQRKGLGIGGPGGPWFVAHKRPKTNEVVLVEGEKNEYLFSSKLIVEDLNFLVNQDLFLEQNEIRCTSKIRYRQEDQKCTLRKINEKYFEVTFDKPQRAATLGQFAVFYLEDTCIAGGKISGIKNLFSNYKIENQSIINYEL